MVGKKGIISIVIVVISVFFVYYTHNNLLVSFTKKEKNKKIIIPNEKFLNIFIPDFAKPLLSDFLWMKLTPEIDLNKKDKETGEKLYKYMMLITDLDPYFYFPYILGGSFLPSKNGYNLFKEGISLLNKGIKYLPEKWQLIFLAGYFYFFEQNKKDIGYKYFQKCLVLKTTPKKIKTLIPLITFKFKSKEERIKKLKILLQETKDRDLKKIIKKILSQIERH